jgi:hypothetical protein
LGLVPCRLILVSVNWRSYSSSTIAPLNVYLFHSPGFAFLQAQN